MAEHQQRVSSTAGGSGHLPSPSASSLGNLNELNSYLASVASLIRDHVQAERVGVYLVDLATGRLAIRAWATADESAVWSTGTTPADLGRNGIDRQELTAGTLRDFVHSAPSGERFAAPIRDGKSWIGALVATSDHALGSRAGDLLHDRAEQLASMLKDTRLAGGERQVEDDESSLDLPSEAILGDPAGDGVAFGSAMVYGSPMDRREVPRKIDEDRSEAIKRLDAAIEATRIQLETLLNDARNELYDVVSLVFSTHVLMLTDEAFSGAMRELVVAGQSPEDAVQAIVDQFVRTFSNLREARLAEKAQDVRDIGRRIMAHLTGSTDQGDSYAHHIVIADDVLPSDLILLAMGHAEGVVIIGATLTAHISILARSLGLPVLMTSDRRAREIVPRTRLLLSADDGALYISPTVAQIHDHGLDPGEHHAGVLPSGTPTVISTDTGECKIQVYANVNLLGDARRAAAMQAEGIGLYRSEFPFIIRNDFVSEDEQYTVYRSIIESMPGKPMQLRTADIGGDKLLAGREEERNPFLGVRGIRFSLANRELFREQLRAMLRAGHNSDLHLMFPMVSSAEEIEDARTEVDASIRELQRRGVPHHPNPKIGAMVELPAAVVSIEDLADVTDFLSIGTNDLIMYLLAVDRTNERLSELYRSHHPVVLRTLADVVARIGDRIENLSVCGEAAADPAMIPFFIGIGIRKLSVAPRRIATVRSIARLYTRETAGAYAAQLLSIRSLRDMDTFLKEYRRPEPLGAIPVV